MNKFYEGGVHSSASAEQACTQKSSEKPRTFQRVHCPPFWKADRLTIFLTPYKPQVVPEESCVAADFWQQSSPH